ncbi:DUF6188 family protein [Leucobacter komagatae]|uniref:DUF6188 family protein n=1 Tax=Leucobacter komagatae TaxID=55969 RepID=UPI00115194EB|nr:DUF6188 family protein [Leucobacter komagatae]
MTSLPRRVSPLAKVDGSLSKVNLRLVGGTVDIISTSYFVTLRFSTNATVQFESDFTIREPGCSEKVISMDGDRSELVPVLRLHNEVVDAAFIAEGTLHLSFSNGTTTEARPDPELESWSYSGPESPETRVIALAGGELAIWLP